MRRPLTSFLSMLQGHDLYRLAKNSLTYGIGNLVQKFLIVLLLPIYTRYLTPADYGIIGLLTLFSMVVGTVTMCALTNGISRYYYYTAQENATVAQVIWSPFLFVLAFTSLVCLMLCPFLAHVSVLLLGSDRYSYVVFLTLVTLLFSNLATIGRSVLIFREKSMMVSVINVAQILIGIVSGIYCVVFLGRGVTGVVEASLVTTVITCVALLMLTVFRHKPSFSWVVLMKQLKFSYPLIGAILAFWIIDSSDRYVLRLFLPMTEVGLYDVGYRIGLMMALVVDGFGLAWPPYYHNRNAEGKAQSICGPTLVVYLLVCSLAFVGLSLVSPLALRLLTTPEFYAAYTIVPWVAGAYLLKGPYIIFLMGVLMKNKSSWQLYLEVAAALLNIVGNIALIPVLGREAAAVTTLFSYGLMVVGSYILVTRVNPIPGLTLPFSVGFFLLALLVASGVLWIPQGSMLLYGALSGALMLLFGGLVLSLGRRMCLRSFVSGPPKMPEGGE